MKVIITGANGFIGQTLCAYLSALEHSVVPVVRRQTALPNALTVQSYSDPALSLAMGGVDTVIHLAAQVHVMNQSDRSVLDKFREINVLGTEHLARVAAAAGVKRLIFLSSIKVNGESTSIAKGYSESDHPNPQDPYAVSKCEAEQALWKVSRETGLEVVIVRPPLVYGPGVKANFSRLLKMVDAGMPLPLNAIKNSRSLIYVGNLVDALLACATHPAAVGQTYLVSDGEDVSTPKLISAIAVALQRPNRNFFIPISLMRGAAKLLGKSNAVDRLTQSLVIDSSKIRRELGWSPPYTMAEGLQVTADWYHQIKAERRS